jgi:hypothetical protein
MASSLAGLAVRSIAGIVLMGLLPAASFAGNILYNFSVAGSPSVTYNPTVAAQAGTCNSFLPYEVCGGQFFDVINFNGFGTGHTDTIAIRNDITASVYSFSSGSSGSVGDPLMLSDPNNPGWWGAQILLALEGNGRLGMQVFNLQGHTGGSFPCGSFDLQCSGAISGEVQSLFTLRYLNSQGTEIGSDTVTYLGQGAQTPEPASFVLMAGAAVAFLIRRRRA